MKVVGISDHTVAIYDPKGLDVAAADRYVDKHGTLQDFPLGDRVDPKELLTFPCDVLVPGCRRARHH